MKMVTEHEIEIRVRYKETDGQGRVHHANYFTYFEMGRVEQLRASGYDYRKLEEQGIMLVLQMKTVRVTPARVEHEYRISRDGVVLAKGNSTLAYVDRTGKVRRMPKWIEMDEAKKGG